MHQCLYCSANLEIVLDLGPQPVSSHFLARGAEPAPEFPLRLAICSQCATAQLAGAFPTAALVPPHEWITYREPEEHLDDLVQRLSALDGISPRSVIGGISAKDQSTIDRFGALGFGNRWCLDIRNDLGAAYANANIESVQALLTREKAEQIARTRGRADVLVARHVVEHATNPRELLEALSHLVSDGGYLVLEVPDNEKNIVREDYTMLWEEHVSYFTESTFRGLLSHTRFQPIDFITYPYFFEDCFVQIARKSHSSVSTEVQAALPGALRLAARDKLRSYAHAFPEWTSKYRQAISRLADGAPAAIYGAGHLTAAFINFHGLADLFAFVVDDTPEKQGLRLPNSGLEIVPRERLVRDGIKLCLFGLSPHAEDKVIEKNDAFVRRGGQFYSVFADSPRSIRRIIS